MNSRSSMAVSLQEKDMKLSISWTNKASPYFSFLTTVNVMEYFADPDNKFYDMHCNNEVIRMQRLAPENLKTLVGVEFVLSHAQEPILFIIKKQHRKSQHEVIPMASYYVLAGTVYQAPDLWSVINSRLLNTSHFIHSAAAELNNYIRYHPSIGYHWDIKSANNSGSNTISFVPSDPFRKAPEETGTQFQRKNVDSLLSFVTQKFPFKPIPVTQHPFGPRVQPETNLTGNGNSTPATSEVAQQQEKSQKNMSDAVNLAKTSR